MGDAPHTSSVSSRRSRVGRSKLHYLAIFALLSFVVAVSFSISGGDDGDLNKIGTTSTNNKGSGRSILDHFFVPGSVDTPTKPSSGQEAAISGTAATDETSPLDPEDIDENTFSRGQHLWKFAEDVNAELTAFDDDMNAEVNTFTAHVLAGAARIAQHDKGTLPKKKGSSDAAITTCAYTTPSHPIVKHEYSHRNKRKNEHSTVEMYRVLVSKVAHQALHGVAAIINNDTTISSSVIVKGGKNNGEVARSSSSMVWTFSHEVPAVLNHFPISLADDVTFNISVPFGAWKSAFYPVDDFMAHHQEAPLPTYLRAPQVLEATPPLYTVVSRNAYVYNGNTVTCDGHMLSSGGCLWDFHISQSPELVRNVPMFDIVIPLCDTWCRGYYHFTHEHLPRLALVHGLLTAPEKDTGGPDIKLVLSHAPVGFARHFLFKVLKIPHSRVTWGKPALGRQVVYPMPQRCGNTMTHLLHLMRDLVFRQMGLIPKSFQDGGMRRYRKMRLKLLFAERSKLSRMPRNYFDLKSKLMVELDDRVEFATVQGNATVSDQIASFHNADIVVGPHGANIANMMWMRPGAHVIEIASIKNGNMCYYATAGRVGVQHHLLLHSSGKDSHFTLEYDLFRRHVVHAVETLETQLHDQTIHPLF